MINKSIAFVGAMGVGKTSVAKRVSEVLGMPYVDIDELRWDYFSKQPDYDNELVETLFDNSKEVEAFSYLKPFEARLVADFLEEIRNAVFDFGAGYSVYEDEMLFSKVKSAFSFCETVILLRYSDDADEGLAALQKRHPDVADNLYNALNRVFIESPCNIALATHVIDTKDKTVDEIVDSALSIVR